MREQGIRDLAVLRAMEAVPRTPFIAPDRAGLAFRDIALPTDCGASVCAPLFVARLMAGSRLDPAMRVLVIGSGAGYAAAVLSHLVASVVAVDRYRTLIETAAARFDRLGRTNIVVQLADGLNLPEDAPFDRILVFGQCEALPQRWPALLTERGAIVHPQAVRDGPERQVLVRAERQADGIARQTIICPSRLPALRPGIARHL